MTNRTIKHLSLLSLMTLLSCGTAKDAYVETKYDLCMKKCDLAHSKYDPVDKGACKAKCVKDKYVD